MLPRSLEYKDKFVYHLIRQINGDCEGEPITFPDNTTPIKFVVEMSLNEFTSVLSALMTGADLSYPDESHQVVWNFLRNLECPVSICDEILSCLQPAFDEINEKLDDIEETVDEIYEQVGGNVAKPPPEVAESVDTRLCGAAVAVVEYMNSIILQTYAESESGFFDNVTEAVAAIISAIPVLGQLPFDELILMANDYFANQQTEYESDYILAFDALVFDLYCKLLQSSGVFTYELWGDWLNGIDTRIPDNRASKVFSSFAPVSATFINQIAAFIFGENSFETFFDEIYLYFLSGAEQPSFICAASECGLWRHTLVAADFPDPATWHRHGEFDGSDIIPTIGNDFGADYMSVGITIVFDAITDISEAIIHQTTGVNIEGADIVNSFIAFYDASDVLIFGDSLPVQNGEWEYVYDGTPLLDVKKIVIEYGWVGTTPFWTWAEVTFAGVGINPFA